MIRWVFAAVNRPFPEATSYFRLYRIAMALLRERLLRGTYMSGAIVMLTGIDRFCGEFATALHNSEPQIYATLAVLLVLGALLFPPKNDSDQV
ncbi:MAG: hypothetical protein WBB34_08400 [Xanthobacteraceae bacterium]